MTDHTNALERIRRAAGRIEYEKARCRAEIRNAHNQGTTLRAIAQAAGISHEQVRRILAR